MTSSGFVSAYLLHSRPYQDEKLLLDLLVHQLGRVRAIARRPSKKQQGASQWPLFCPLNLLLVGQHELKTVRQLEQSQLALPLQGHYLFSGLYLNELICRLFQADTPAEPLFEHYQQALQQLGYAQLHQQSLAELEPILRCFELQVLTELGQPVIWCDRQGERLAADGYYHYRAGFERASKGWLGADLLAIAANDWHAGARRAAKLLCRQLLAPRLGSQPLQSRQLFDAIKPPATASGISKDLI